VLPPRVSLTAERFAAVNRDQPPRSDRCCSFSDFMQTGKFMTNQECRNQTGSYKWSVPPTYAAVEVGSGGQTKKFNPPEISAMILAKLKDGRKCGSEKKSPRPSSRSGLFQRFATAGHQGRRAHRRPGSFAHHK